MQSIAQFLDYLIKFEMNKTLRSTVTMLLLFLRAYRHRSKMNTAQPQVLLFLRILVESCQVPLSL